MGKLFLLLLVVVVVVIVLRAAAGSARKSPEKAGKNQPTEHGPEVMVPCAFCGLNVPKSEALADGSRFYCSMDHVRRNRNQ